MLAVLGFKIHCRETQKKGTAKGKAGKKRSLMDSSDDPLSTLSDYEDEAGAAEDSSEDSRSSGEQGRRLAGYSNIFYGTGSKIAMAVPFQPISCQFYHWRRNQVNMWFVGSGRFQENPPP